MVYQKSNKLFVTLLVIVTLFGMFSNLFISQSVGSIHGNSISFIECESYSFNILHQVSGNTIVNNILFHLTEAENAIERVSLRYSRLKGWASGGRKYDGYLSDKSYVKPPESIFLQSNLFRIMKFINEKDGKK